MKILYRKIFPLNVRAELFLLRSDFNSYCLKKTGYSFKTFCTPTGKKLRQIKQFKNKYAGKRCFIMGNGPSLNQMNLNLFKDEYVWGSNRCYLLYDKINWKHKFYVSIDTRVLPDISNEVNTLTDKLEETQFFFPIDFYISNTIKNKKNTFFFNQLPFNWNIRNTMFSFDPSKWMSSGCTVTISALQLAVYMGFSPIYLIGCDTSYKIMNSVDIDTNDSNSLTSTEDDDDNHFDPRYFGKGKKWHDPHVELMLKHYESVKKMCDNRKIKIYNATVGGNLEIFPRVDYDSLF